MILLVTGGRTYANTRRVDEVLYSYHDQEGITLLIHGACKTGLDALAHTWAIENEVPVLAIPARWSKHGKSAGPRRNRIMLQFMGILPTKLVAFPGGPGTADMITAATTFGLPISEING